MKGRYENRPVLAPFIAFSAGALVSTVEDLAKWDAALYADHILTKANREQMWTPVRANDGTVAALDYGFGWFVERYHGSRLVQHTGGTPGFSSAIYRFLDEELTVIILANHGDRVIDHLAIEAAGMYARSLRRPSGRRDPDPAMSATIKRAFVNLLKGAPEPEAFTPAMRAFLRTTTSKAWWEWYAAQGHLQSMNYFDSETAGDYRVLRYEVELDAGTYWVPAKVAPDGKIAPIYWW